MCYNGYMKAYILLLSLWLLPVTSQANNLEGLTLGSEYEFNFDDFNKNVIKLFVEQEFKVNHKVKVTWEHTPYLYRTEKLSLEWSYTFK